MENESSRPAPWGLGRRLMTKSLELAFEDPLLAVRLANLAVRASVRFEEGCDPDVGLAMLRVRREKRS